MIVLVCGGRDFQNERAVRERLAQLPMPNLVIHGGAPGADRLAANVARSLGIHTAEVLALWNIHGNAAGPLRNAAMLRLGPDRVIAFPGGRGTENCIAQAEKAGIPVERVGWSTSRCVRAVGG